MLLVLKREEVDAKETDNQGKEVKYSIRLPKKEYAKLSSEISNRQFIQKKPSFDYAYTYDNFYIYDYLGDGVFRINFVMPIIGNEDFIDIIYKAIDNGTITDTAGFDIYAKNLSSKQRTNYRRFANAFKKRYGNRSYGTLDRGNTASNGRRDTKNRYGFGRDAASRGTSRNADEFGDEVVKNSLREATGERLTPAMIRHHMMENVTRRQEWAKYVVKVNNLLIVFNGNFAYHILIE